MSGSACPVDEPCNAATQCYFYSDGTGGRVLEKPANLQGCWGELDPNRPTCPPGWKKIGETSEGCALNHTRPKCEKTAFSSDPVECCFSGDGTDRECPPDHCERKKSGETCTKTIENYCTAYDPTTQAFGKEIYDRMNEQRCQEWARSAKIRDRPRVKDAVFKYCRESGPLGLRDPFCACVNADVTANCPESRRCTDPDRNCCYSYRFRNEPAMLSQSICFAEECQGNVPGAYTWTPTDCTEACAPIVQFKGDLTSRKRIALLVDCREGSLSTDDKRKYFGSEEEYEAAAERAKKAREESGELVATEINNANETESPTTGTPPSPSGEMLGIEFGYWIAIGVAVLALLGATIFVVWILSQSNRTTAPMRDGAAMSVSNYDGV